MSWESTLLGFVKDIPENETYQESADRLRRLVRSKALLYADAKTNPDKFFAAHRLLVDAKRGPGFCIRFTVQYNLFAGTVSSLGNPEQVKLLEEMQERGELGCFALTEKLAGVNSGLVVNTVAVWDPKKQSFVLDSPNEGAQKNWISQGLTAENAAVIADLRVRGKSYGPHGFLVKLRDSKTKSVLSGVTLGDMGRKTTGNDLDNAWIKFDHVVIPKSSLLSKFADIRNDEYVQTTKERMRIEIIGQRLLTGRIAIAQAALGFAKRLFSHTKEYTSSKKCWAPGSEPKLGEIPHVSALFVEAEKSFSYLDAFCGEVERRLSKTLTEDTVPSQELIAAIACAKVQAVEHSISLTFRLKQEVGSYALLGDSGFEHLDFLQCCKFAEGDSRILMQKLARDRVRDFGVMMKNGMTTPPKGLENEANLALTLAQAGKNGWDDAWQTVYGLADQVMYRTMNEVVGAPFPFRDKRNDVVVSSRL